MGIANRPTPSMLLVGQAITIWLLATVHLHDTGIVYA